MPRAGELVTVGEPAAVTSGWTGSPRTGYFSYPVCADVRDRNRVLAGLYATGSAGTLDVVAAGGLTSGGAAGG